MQEDKRQIDVENGKIGAVLLPGLFLIPTLLIGAKALVDKFF